jgi:tetratricopeptide (TPR) repeat protein
MTWTRWSIAARYRSAKTTPAGAVDSLQQAIKNDPNNAVAHYQLGIAFDMQHNDARAESEWRAAVRLRPDLTDAQRALAALELRRGDLDALTQTAQQIITNAPYAPDGYLMRALAEMNRQKYSDAQQDLTKAMGWLRGVRRPTSDGQPLPVAEAVRGGDQVL